VNEGTPIHTTIAGKVVWAGSNGPWGNLVVVENNGYQVWLAHLSSIQVSEGEILNYGDVVGLSGNTGNSTGAHLHYGIAKDRRKSYVWLNPNFFTEDVYISLMFGLTHDRSDRWVTFAIDQPEHEGRYTTPSVSVDVEWTPLLGIVPSTTPVAELKKDLALPWIRVTSSEWYLADIKRSLQWVCSLRRDPGQDTDYIVFLFPRLFSLHSSSSCVDGSLFRWKRTCSGVGRKGRDEGDCLLKGKNNLDVLMLEKTSWWHKLGRRSKDKSKRNGSVPIMASNA
jgi:hypothetical protein